MIPSRRLLLSCTLNANQNDENDAKMVIIFKKGNKKDLKDYRPICLLSNICKVFTKVLIKRLEKTLDENQPREQAGFKSGYSTTDNIHVVNQLKEKCIEYIISHSASHSSTTRKPSTQCKLKQHCPRFKNRG